MIQVLISARFLGRAMPVRVRNADNDLHVSIRARFLNRAMRRINPVGTITLLFQSAPGF